MKKLLLLTLLSLVVLSSMSFAAMKIGVAGSFGTNSWDTQPILVITPGNLKNVDYDILLGYSSVGVGEDIDTQIGMVVGGTWWLGMNGPINYGMTALYYSQGTTNGGAGGDKASDNTITTLDLLFSAKTPIVASLDVRADVLLYSSVGGKSGGADIKDSNQMFSTIQLSLQYDFTL
jgi:hypothetical protein